MEIASAGGVSGASATEQTTAVLKHKRAMDVQASQISQLLDKSLPASNPAHLGNKLDVKV